MFFIAWVLSNWERNKGVYLECFFLVGLANMENPYEKVQSNILSRIIGNVERLNESVVILNQELRRVNSKNKNLELMSQMCENYRESVDFQLQATSKKQEPL